MIVVPVTAAGVVPPTIPSTSPVTAPINPVLAVIVVPVIAAGVVPPTIPSTLPVKAPVNVPAIEPAPVIVGAVNVLFVNVCVSVN